MIAVKVSASVLPGLSFSLFRVPTPEADQFYFGEVLMNVLRIAASVIANADEANAKGGRLDYSATRFHSFLPSYHWIFTPGHYPSSRFEFEGSPLGELFHFSRDMSHRSQISLGISNFSNGSLMSLRS